MDVSLSAALLLVAAGRDMHPPRGQAFYPVAVGQLAGSDCSTLGLGLAGFSHMSSWGLFVPLSLPTSWVVGWSVHMVKTSRLSVSHVHLVLYEPLSLACDTLLTLEVLHISLKSICSWDL